MGPTKKDKTAKSAPYKPKSPRKPRKSQLDTANKNQERDCASPAINSNENITVTNIEPHQVPVFSNNSILAMDGELPSTSSVMPDSGISLRIQDLDSNNESQDITINDSEVIPQSIDVSHVNAQSCTPSLAQFLELSKTVSQLNEAIKNIKESQMSRMCSESIHLGNELRLNNNQNFNQVSISSCVARNTNFSNITTSVDQLIDHTNATKVNQVV